MPNPAVVNTRSEQLVRDGKVVEAGWESFRAQVVSPYASPGQVREMRLAFFAGARYLMSAVLGLMDESEEPTEADIAVMKAIEAELTAFGDEITARHAHDETSTRGD